MLAALLLFRAMPVMGTPDFGQQKEPFDIIITHGTLIDGTGRPAFQGDIAIRDDRIVVVGKIAKGVKANMIIDAKNRIVSPGFIDIHTHADRDILWDRYAINFVMQGSTTLLGGNCGSGASPIGDFLEMVNNRKTGPNIGLLAGHGDIRRRVMGMANRAPTPEELDEMKVLVRQAMEEGAIGLSSGLTYTPGNYADLNELVELCRVVAEYDGLYASNVREQSHAVRESWQEIIDTSEQTRIRATISHAKVIGRPYWGTSHELIDMLHRARDRGVNVFCDAYPYDAGSTTIVGVLIPQWVQADGRDAMRARLQDPALLTKIRAEIADLLYLRGGAEGVLITWCDLDPSIERRYLNDIAAEWGLDPIDAVIKIVVVLGNARAIYFNGTEADQEVFYSSPYCAVISDASCAFSARITGRLVHPRTYGTMPRFLGQYVRERGIVSLEQGIRQMTSLPAEIMGIRDRGVIATGKKADLVVFDYDEIIDNATYLEPHQYSNGIKYVILNGKVIVANGVSLKMLPGVGIYGPAFPPGYWR